MMNKRVRWTVVGFVALMLALGSAGPGQATPTPFATGFEVSDGGLGPWTQTGSPMVGPVTGAGSVHSGVKGANFLPGTPSMVLTSPLTTVAGQEYEIDFWLRINTESATGPPDFEVFWDGSNLPGTAFEAQAFNRNWQEFMFLATATGTSTSFGFSASLATAGNYRLDDVTVSAIHMPEPASLTLLGLGMVGLLGYQWRRRQRTITK